QAGHPLTVADLAQPRFASAEYDQFRAAQVGADDLQTRQDAVVHRLLACLGTLVGACQGQAASQQRVLPRLGGFILGPRWRRESWDQFNAALAERSRVESVLLVGEEEAMGGEHDHTRRAARLEDPLQRLLLRVDPWLDLGVTL